MREKRLGKLAAAIRCIGRKSGATLKELAEALDTGERQARRMLETLQDLQFPLYDELPAGEREKRWRFDETFLHKLPNNWLFPAELTLEECIALYAVRNTSSLANLVDWKEQVDSALEKVGGTLPSGFSAMLGRMQDVMKALDKCSKDYCGKEDLLDALIKAMLRRVTCHIAYTSFSKKRDVQFHINPLYLFEHCGGLYCLVQSTKYLDIRCIAVERIQSLTMEEAHFDPPRDFDPEALLGSAFGVVWAEPFFLRVKVAATLAPYIKERTWSPSQCITELESGDIVLEMQTSGRQEVKRWVLGMGAAAEVLEPDWLRDSLREDAAMLMQLYTKSSATGVAERAGGETPPEE
ncbi:MAG: WYL domain-containing protein [Desulfovibrio sp.]|nr:WYL domain-containing protein [Desulfovibrio sp.]